MNNSNLRAADHRATARQMLGANIFSNNWMMALVAILINSLIVSGASSFTFGIAAFFITGPLMFGISSCFLRLSREGTVKIENLFDGFSKDFLQNFLISLMTAIFTFLWSLLFIIPGIVKSYAYSMAFYIKNDHPEYDWKQCLDESQRIMVGNKWKLFCLQFSFIGWMFVGSLVCGIGILWVSPYMQAANTSFYENIKNN